MKIKTISIYPIISLLLALSACQYLQPNKANQNGKLIAQAFESKLYENDIDMLNIQAKTTADSVAKALQFTNNWMKENAILYNAKEQLGKEELDKINQQVEDYRNSLIMYSYERALTVQKMDTNVNTIEIAKYYNKNISNFLSNSDLVKIRYMILPNNCVELEEIKEEFENIDDDSSTIEHLQDMSFKYNAKYSLTGQWFNYKDFIKKMNIKTVRNAEGFLKNNVNLNYTDSLKTYMVKIDKFTLAGDTMGLEYCLNDIKALMLNQRKKIFLNETKDNIYKAAVDNNDVQLFNNK